MRNSQKGKSAYGHTGKETGFDHDRDRPLSRSVQVTPKRKKNLRGLATEDEKSMT